jgi:hypothetical protein
MFNHSVTFPSLGRCKVQVEVSDTPQRSATRARNMDEYQEEVLEFKAFELDPPESADDATEL